MSIVERIKKLCEKNKITIAELERNAGISNGVIRRWDEYSPGSDKLSAVADYFGVTTDYLLGRTKNKQAFILEGDALPEELKGLDIQMEVIQAVAESGLSAKQIQRALRLYKLYEAEYGDDQKTKR